MRWRLILRRARAWLEALQRRPAFQEGGRAAAALLSLGSWGLVALLFIQ